MSDRLLNIKNLKVDFNTEEGVVNAVDNISFNINNNETLGIVGESGCGKSVTALAILQLIQSPPGIIRDGCIYFEGENLLTKSQKEMRKIRGIGISMIFQEPMTSLNPLYSCGEQIAEAVRHEGRVKRKNINNKEVREKVIEMLRIVGIPNPERVANEYPHQLSGGMRQRVMIAIALSCKPKLLIADEPTTALDVTIQAQFFDLLKTLKKDFGMSIMLITHDLGVIAEMTERVIVMYSGVIVEAADVDTLFYNPLHPYTKGLINSIPNIASKKGYLNVIRGSVIDSINITKGCRFCPRCDYVKDICFQKTPLLNELKKGHFVACWASANDQQKGVLYVK